MPNKNHYHQIQTTPYSVAHHIWMFLLVCGCIIIVAWLLIAAGYRGDDTPTNTVVDDTIVRAEQLSPCVRRVNEIVAQMWTYNPANVPTQYWEMAAEYVNDTVDVRTTGTCNGVGYTCTAGQHRRDCNPCAASDAMDAAMRRHASDLIAQHCSNQ